MKAYCMRQFFLGIAATAAAAIGLAWFAVAAGLVPINADAPPSALERWAAHTAVIAGVQRHMARRAKPPAGADAILDGIRVYKANCEVCHGGNSGEPSRVARGLYQRPPQFPKDGVEEIPFAYTAWVVAHGIRLTGMPAFSHTLSPQEIDDVAAFLGRMNALTPDARFAFAGRPLAPQLQSLYRTVGGERACTYLPSPNARPHRFRSEATVTPDGAFFVIQFYNRGISEVAVFGYDAKKDRLIRTLVNKNGTADVAVSPRTKPDDPAWNTIAGTDGPGAVTAIAPQNDGSYRFRSSNAPGFGACAADGTSQRKVPRH